MRKSLKNILTLNFNIVAVLPIIIGLVALESLRFNMENEITTKNNLLAKSLVGELGQFLEEPKTLLRQITGMIEKNEFIAPDELNDFLNLLIDTYDFFNMIKILDQDGKIQFLAPYDENIYGLDISAYHFWQKTKDMNRTYWSRTFISPQTGRPTLTVSTPMTNGMIVGNLDLSDLNRIAKKMKIGSQGYAMITDNDGTIIAHVNPTYVSQRLNVKNLFPTRQSLTENEGSIKYTDLGGKKIGSVAIVPQTGWLVMIIQSEDEAFASVRTVRNIISAGCMAAILLAVFISFFVIKKTLVSKYHKSDN